MRRHFSTSRYYHKRGMMFDMSELQIVRTNILTVEIFHLPVMDLSHRFLFRIVEPIPMNWQIARMSFSIRLGLDDTGPSSASAVSNMLLNKWKDIIQETKNAAYEGWAREFSWLEEVDQVKMIDCVMVHATKVSSFDFLRQELNQGSVVVNHGN